MSRVWCTCSSDYDIRNTPWNMVVWCAWVCTKWQMNVYNQQHFGFAATYLGNHEQHAIISSHGWHKVQQSKSEAPVISESASHNRDLCSRTVASSLKCASTLRLSSSCLVTLSCIIVSTAWQQTLRHNSSCASKNLVASLVFNATTMTVSELNIALR